MTQADFIAAAFRNPVNRAIVSRLPGLHLPDSWLVSGALFQSAWNAISGRAPDYGIKDYDIFYFDPDTSWDAEDAVIKRGAQTFADVGVQIEIRNQARVHLWYQSKFGAPYAPLSRATEGIDRFLMTCAMVGIAPAAAGGEVYAPSGFADLEQMVLRPNQTANFRAEAYYAKAASLKRRWPEVTMLSA